MGSQAERRGPAALPISPANQARAKLLNERVEVGVGVVGGGRGRCLGFGSDGWVGRWVDESVGLIC